MIVLRQLRRALQVWGYDLLCTILFVLLLWACIFND